MEADFGSKIEAARKAGYSDDEIVQHLSSGELGPKIKTATDAGYNSKDILDHLGGGQSQPVPAQEDEGIVAGIGRRLKTGADQMLEGIGTTAQAIAPKGSELSRVGGVMRDAIATPPDQPTDAQQFVNPSDPSKAGPGGFDYNKLPGAIVEQTPQIAGSIAARGVGAGLGFAAAGPPGALIGGLAAPTVLGFVQRFGPEALAVAKRNGREEPNAMDWLNAGGSAAAQGILDAIPLKGLNSYLTPFKEAGSQALQSAVQQSTDTGKVDPHEAAGQAIIGAGTGAVAGGATDLARGALKVGKATAKLAAGDQTPPEVADARREVANRFTEQEADQGLNLKDKESLRHENEAWLALNNVHSQISREIKTVRNALAPELNGGDVKSLDDLMERAQVHTAFDEANNKLKNTVSEKELSLIKSKVGGTVEGDKLISLLRQSNELTRLARRGINDGISQFTNKLNPLSPQGGILATVGSLAGHTALGGISGGIVPALQTTGYVGGKVIDAVTGNRFPINKFTRKYAGISDSPDVGRSILADRAAQKLQGDQDKAAGRKSALEADALRTDTFRSLYQKFRDGSLTPDDIEANKDNLSKSDYKLFYDKFDATQKKAAADALKQDRAVVRQGEIMGQQRAKEEQANLKDLTTGMRMTARGRAQASAQAEAQAAALDRFAERESRKEARAMAAANKADAKAEVNDLLKEGTDLATSGRLTDEWLVSARDSLSPSQYANFAGKLARQKAKAEKAAQGVKEGPSPGKAPRAPKGSVVWDDTLQAIAVKDSKGLTGEPLFDIEDDVQGNIPGKTRKFDRAVNAGKYSLDDVASKFTSTREALRSRYGNKLTLWRADAPDSEKTSDTQTLYMGDEKLARKFAANGRQAKPYTVNTDDVVAVYARPSGYFEFIVKKPQVSQPKAVRTDQAKPTPSPFAEPVNPIPQTHVEFPDAHARRTVEIQTLRTDAVNRAELVQDPVVHHAVNAALDALDSLPDSHSDGYERRVHNNRVKVANAIRDAIPTAEGQTLFDSIIRHYRDAFKKTSLNDALERVRKAQGLDDLPDVPF